MEKKNKTALQSEALLTKWEQLKQSMMRMASDSLGLPCASHFTVNKYVRKCAEANVNMYYTVHTRATIEH